jgi:hypothetical protein
MSCEPEAIGGNVTPQRWVGSTSGQKAQIDSALFSCVCTGGLKGFRRSSRKSVIPFSMNFGFSLVQGNTF